jgi:hypothetical protein
MKKLMFVVSAASLLMIVASALPDIRRYLRMRSM